MSHPAHPLDMEQDEPTALTTDEHPGVTTTMQNPTVSAIGMPPTPTSPVRSYYRYPAPHDDLWLYYDGETWVGEPRTLPWLRQPASWARGRAPVWSFLAAFGMIVVGIALTLSPWR